MPLRYFKTLIVSLGAVNFVLETRNQNFKNIAVVNSNLWLEPFSKSNKKWSQKITEKYSTKKSNLKKSSFAKNEFSKIFSSWEEPNSNIRLFLLNEIII